MFGAKAQTAVPIEYNNIVISSVLDPGLGDEIKLRKQPVRNDSLDRIEPAIDAEEFDFVAVH